jgi:hypothetical protein
MSVILPRKTNKCDPGACQDLPSNLAKRGGQSKGKSKKVKVKGRERTKANSQEEKTTKGKSKKDRTERRS